MNNRERLINSLLCKEVDRPPFPMWLGFSPWEQTLERWKLESGIKNLNLTEYFAFEPFFRELDLEYGPFPRFQEKVIKEDKEFIFSRDYRGITVRRRRDGMSMPEWIDHPAKTQDEWERYKSERLSGPVKDRLHALFSGMDFQDDEAIQAGVFPWGVFGTLRDLLGAERTLFAFYDQPEMVRHIIDTFVTLWLDLYALAAEYVTIDHIHIWEDMSGKQGSLISMNMVEEFMMPSYDRIIEFAKENGIPLSTVDTDGKCDELLTVMTEHGINGFMPFEVQAGNDIERFRSRYEKLGIMGGLDKNALAKSRNDINKEIAKAERMLARGGYIVGFDHAIPPDVPWENYKYAVECIRKLIL